MRFYVAAPLRYREGFNLGAVWVIDLKPRELASGEAEILDMLAELAMNQMELRLYADKLAELLSPPARRSATEVSGSFRNRRAGELNPSFPLSSAHYSDRGRRYSYQGSET